MVGIGPQPKIPNARTTAPVLVKQFESMVNLKLVEGGEGVCCQEGDGSDW